MATDKQELGALGEILIAKKCACPRCGRKNCLKRLPPNFKCADIICDFCGFLGQVKTTKVDDINLIPNTILGAAWGPQKERMEAKIKFPLFLVLISKLSRKSSVYYLGIEHQPEEIFVPRKPLSLTARRAGWQGFTYDLKAIKSKLVKLL